MASLVRTESHVYPQEELNAMTNFYGGKRCVIQRMLNNVEWSHLLDVESPDERLSEMLTRKLRQDRHPRHAAQVRENIVPLKIEHHVGMDAQLTQSTLFLHEDILARTLDYEQDLRDWRIAELNAGRSDPGRPEYEEVFGGTSTTQHRYHAVNSFSPFLRNSGSDAAGVLELYLNKDCPGIDHPDSQKNFPIIDTLLSIPFSLLHTLPRLSGIIPISTYQQQLIAMGSEIISLWWWDPSSEMITKSEEIRRQNIDANQQDDTRKPKPYTIHHPSRNATTLWMKQPTITYSTRSTSASDHSLNQDPHINELSSGQILLSVMPFISRGKDGTLILGNDELGGNEMLDVQHTDKSILVGVTSPPMTSEAYFDDIDIIDDDVEENLARLSCHGMKRLSTPE